MNKTNYRSDIDGMRALAVIPVVLFHAGIPQFSGGYIGVDIFFVISGFLITTLLLKDFHQKKIDLLNFYLRRVRRIVPALLFSIFLMLPYQLKDFAESIISTTFFLSNFHFWIESGYFDVSSEFKPLLHTWSLSIEEQYYIFFPLILIFILKKKIFFISILLVFFISLIFSEFASDKYISANYFLTPSRIWEIVAGCLCANFLFYHKKKIYIIPNNLRNKLPILGFALITFSIFLFDDQTKFPSLIGLIPVLGISMIIIFNNNKNIIYKILSKNYLVKIGLISYSVYLFHQPIFAFGRFIELNNLLFNMLIPTSFLFGYASWRFIEKPFRNPNSVSNKSLLIITLTAIILLNSFALFALFKNGYLKKYNSEDYKILNINPYEEGNKIREKIKFFRNKKFEINSKKNILIIGDSFSEDLINSLLKKRISQNYNLSLHYIGAECGALFVDNKDFEVYINKRSQFNCEKSKIYKNKKLISRIKKSDFIFFSSSWKNWQVKFLNESIKNLEKITAAEILIFGSKDFGEISIQNLIKLKTNNRKNFKSKVRKDRLLVNKLIDSTIEKKYFVNLQNIICNESDMECKIFNNKGQLITYDGSHLTNDGAELVGELLEKNKALIRIFN